MPNRLLPALLAAVLLAGCAGYRLGGLKPTHLSAVESIHVAAARNKTQIPRAAAAVTNSLVDAFTLDGSYRIATIDTADARLETVLEQISYQQVRASSSDSLISEELEMSLILSWKLVDAANPLRVLEEGSSSGSTRFFADPNLQTARQVALADALKRAADSVVARLADGF